MEIPQVTLVIVPRERFSDTERSLHNIYEHTTFPFRLVYISAGAPPHIKQFLERESRQRDFQLVNVEHYLAPNEARNLGLCEVKTKYVVFMDNDARVRRGWLEALVRCAEETGASVVGPLYLEGEIEPTGEAESDTIHMAGGVSHIEQERGKRILYDEHLLAGKRLTAQRNQISKGPRDYVEFHCMLVRTHVFERVGALDEQLLSINEHMDFCFDVRKAGGSVYLEPAAVTSYVAPPLYCDWHDLAYFMLRWSEVWNRTSANRFNEKRGFDGVRFFGDQSNLVEDSVVNFGRSQRRLLTGLRIPSGGNADRPESPVEEAELMLAVLQSVDRDVFYLTLANGHIVEQAADLDPRALMRRLPRLLQQADEQGYNVMIRARGQGRPNQPLLLRVDNLEEKDLARLQAHAFLILETGPQRYQCWLAIVVGAARGAAAARVLAQATNPARAGKGNALLAGSRNFSRATDPLNGGNPRVRVASAHTGLLNTLAQLEREGLTPYLWAGEIC